MLLNISSDRIIFIAKHEHIILPYGDLEKELSQVIYQHISTYTEPLIVINGPGSFTNLRIATLALNTYNTLNNFSLDFIHISKINLYKMLYNRIPIRQNNSIKRYCIMYIGQKKNFWLVDLVSAIDENIMEGQNDGIRKLHVDDIKDCVSGLGDEWFIDEMVAEGKDMMDSIFGGGIYNMYHVNENDVMALGQSDVIKMLMPNYIIQPNID